jgi:hypothetical protein
MRALLGTLLTVWLSLVVSHPAVAEKRVGRPERSKLLSSVLKGPHHRQRPHVRRFLPENVRRVATERRS